MVGQERDDTIPSGETVLWRGSPPGGLHLAPEDAFKIPISAAIAAFTVFWLRSAIEGNAPPFFLLFGAALSLLAFYALVGRFFIDAFLRGRTRYALTDRAAYITRTGPRARVNRFATGALDTLAWVPGSGGRGTIRFAPVERIAANGQVALSFWSNTSLTAFEDIPDAKNVYDRIVALRN